MYRLDKKRKILYIVFIVLLLTVIVFSLSNFSSLLQKSIYHQTGVYLTEISQQNASLLDTELAANLQSLKPIAAYLASLPDMTSKEALLSLRVMAESSGFTRLSLVLPSGAMYSSASSSSSPIQNVSSRDYFQKGMSGESDVSNVITSVISGEPIIVISVPIFKDGQVIGVLGGFYELNAMQSLLDLTTLSQNSKTGTTNTFVVSASGMLVLNSVNSPLSILPGETFPSDDPLLSDGDWTASIRTNMENKASGFAKYSYAGETRYIAYAPSSYNDWYLFSSIPSDLIDHQFDEVNAMGTELSIRIVLIFLAIFLLFLFFEIKSLRDLRKSHTQTLLSEERYKTAIDLSNDIIFEWNGEDRSIYLNPKWYDTFDFVPSYHQSADSFLAFDALHPEDRLVYSQYTKQLLLGQTPPAFECRLHTKDGSYGWFRIRAAALRDSAGTLTRLIGALTDITLARAEKHSLIRKSQTDSLTKLLNKAAGEQLIAAYIAENPGTLSAFLIVDIDHFKEINDQFGHPFGDRVLVSLAESLRRTFRKSDLCIRIGGDEFAVFLKEMPSPEFALSKSNEMIVNFIQSNTAAELPSSISLSIGIAYYPDDGEAFASLYRNADLALYSAKQNGRGQYRTFGSLSDKR